MGIINSFFHILHGWFLWKQKEMVVQTPEWKFKANVARNATFEGHLGQIFVQLESKIAKKLIIFKKKSQNW